jgi:multimeric flavodoxin WrbA
LVYGDKGLQDLLGFAKTFVASLPNFQCADLFPQALYYADATIWNPIYNQPADAIIFGSPTYMGSVTWQFKKFADASSKAWFTQAWKDKIFAGFTNSATMNGDKHSTLHYFITLAMQHSGIWVGTGLMPSNSKAAQRNDVNYVGSFAGAMAQSPSDSSPEEMLPGDLETAKLFGQRVAATTARFK